MERNIDSRGEILKERNTQALNSVRTVEHREKQILNKKMDAWIRACMDERNFVATDYLIKTKATELMNLHNLWNFVPDADWILSIRQKYNLKKEEDQSSDAPDSDTSFSEEDNNRPAKEQVRQIRRNDGQPQISIIGNQNAILSKYDTLRRFKLELLNDTMFEWVLRMRATGFAYRLTVDLILHTVKEANKHINIPKFNPHRWWLKRFRLKYYLMKRKLKPRYVYDCCDEIKDHLPLDMPDIIEFVKQNRSKYHPSKTHRYHITYRYRKRGLVIEDVVPVDEDTYSTQTSLKLDETNVDVVPVKCISVVPSIVPVKDSCTSQKSRVEVVEIDDDDVPEECEDVVDDVDGKPVPAKRYTNTYSRLKCRSVDPSIVPIKGTATPQKSRVELVEIVDHDVPVKCEEVIDDDFSLDIEDIIASLDPVDDDDVDAKKEHSHKVKYGEEACVPRKEKGIETQDSWNTKKIIRSDEDALRYLEALEKFALLQRNIRAIVAIAKLEASFRNPDGNN